MTITTNWNLSADVLAEYTAEDGTVFSNVIEDVHWRVTATDDASGESVSIYGSQAIPRPTNSTDFIDLSVLQDMTADEKRATILQWAEAIEPGFIAEKEAAVSKHLADKIAQPKVQSVGLI